MVEYDSNGKVVRVIPIHGETIISNTNHIKMNDK